MLVCFYRSSRYNTDPVTLLFPYQFFNHSISISLEGGTGLNVVDEGVTPHHITVHGTGDRFTLFYIAIGFWK
ncbi:MAG: hypothetical protein ACRCWI_07685 [Brevinema sp.]